MEFKYKQEKSLEERKAEYQKVIEEHPGKIGVICEKAPKSQIDFWKVFPQIDLPTLKLMYLGKTGALFRAAIRSGAILAEASAKKLNELTRYADAFGLAFQITDDILDVTGNDEILGKSTGSDEKNSKATFVSLTSIDEARHHAQMAVDEAIDALRFFGSEADFLRELVQYLIEREK